MNLTVPPFVPFKIMPGEVTIIETGSRELYQELIFNFQGIKDDINFSTDSNDLVEMTNALRWIGDPMLIGDLNKLFQAKILKYFSQVISEEASAKLIELARSIKTEISEQALLLDLPLEVVPDIEINKIVKFADIQYSSQFIEYPYDIIEAVLKTFSELEETKIIGFMNISDYLDETGFNDLVDLVKTLDLKVLHIKFSEFKRSEKYDECRYYYIDNDFVDWRC